MINEAMINYGDDQLQVKKKKLMKLSLIVEIMTFQKSDNNSGHAVHQVKIKDQF